MTADFQNWLILLGAGGLLLLLLILTWVLARRSAARTAGAQVTDVVSELTNRVDELAADLLRALERAERESQLSRVFGELSATIDIDDVLSRIVKTSTALADVDAAVVILERDEEERIVVAEGMPIEEAKRQSFAGPEAHALAITYRYAEGASEGMVRSALALPLQGEDGPLGFLAVYSKSETELGSLELDELAARAGPAIENALRFREARRLADLDALTGLHNRRYFHETLSREVARAQRYGRRLALVVVDLDDFKAINEKIGHLAGDGVLAEAAERIKSVVRNSDIACRVGGDEFAVILPESGIGQADQLYRRIQAAVTSRPIGQVPRLDLSAGVAELSESDDGTAIFERADEALYRAKDAGKARAYPALTIEPPAEDTPSSANSA